MPYTQEQIQRLIGEATKPLDVQEVSPPTLPLPKATATPEFTGMPEAVGVGLIKGYTETAGSVGTGMQYIGGKLGIEALEREGKLTHEYWERAGEKYVPPESLRGKIWENPALLKKGTWWAYNTAKMLPSFAAAMVPYVGTAKYAVPTIKVLGTAMKFSPATVARLAWLAPRIVGGTAGGALEGTNTYQEILRKGGTKRIGFRFKT